MSFGYIISIVLLILSVFFWQTDKTLSFIIAYGAYFVYVVSFMAQEKTKLITTDSFRSHSVLHYKILIYSMCFFPLIYTVLSSGLDWSLIILVTLVMVVPINLLFRITKIGRNTFLACRYGQQICIKNGCFYVGTHSFMQSEITIKALGQIIDGSRGSKKSLIAYQLFVEKENFIVFILPNDPKFIQALAKFCPSH
ncbi:hypothetical protein [Neisseria sp. Ec49-e6-T10]|uniref:hypothetical protein n=1 Tax=Neisseria sp. Ec49-e6-T10 TaxID=3140744 RepID=UPI003EB83783